MTLEKLNAVYFISDIWLSYIECSFSFRNTTFAREPPKFLKIGAKELATPLTTLYNTCIDQGEWPEDWKKGEWVPAFKKDDNGKSKQVIDP
jgi:hypothetical protein